MRRRSRGAVGDRRLFRRSATLLPAWAFIDASGERLCLRGVIRDLSLGGAVVSLYRGPRPIPDLDEGPLELELGFLPSGSGQAPGPGEPGDAQAAGREAPLSFRCRALRRLGRDGMLEQMALRFLAPGSRELFALKRYLRLQEEDEPWADGASALVLDDDDVYRMLLRGYLERMRYRVLEAPNGRQGLEIFGARSVKLVVVDMFMPVMDGLEVIQAIRRQRPETRVLAISGGLRGQFEVLNAARLLGASAILRKPFDRTMLAQALRSMPGRRKVLSLPAAQG